MDDWIFRDAPDIDATTTFPPISTEETAGSAEYLFSGSMARESLWMLAR